MKKRGIADDADGDDRKVPAGAPPRTATLSETSIKKDDFAEEFPSKSVRDGYGRDLGRGKRKHKKSHKTRLGHGSARRTKILDHAPPSEPISARGTKKLEHAPPGESPWLQMVEPPGIRMEDSLGSPPVVFESRHDVAPGAFPVRSSRNTATNLTIRAPMSSYDSPAGLTADESKQEEELPNSAGAHTGVHNSSRMAAGSALYTVEAQLVAHRNEEEEDLVMVAEAQYVRMKWYQRPFYRWMFLGLALFACCLVGAVVVLVVLVNRPPSAASSSSLTSPSTAPTASPTTTIPTSAPTPEATAAPIRAASPEATASVAASSETPTAAPTKKAPTRAPTLKATTTSKQIACDFLSIPDLTTCQSTLDFFGFPTGYIIPSEIGLLTQLTYVEISNKALMSTIPTEIGLLTQLTLLDFYLNFLTSAIPTEIGLLTQLTLLDFSMNALTSAIPTEIGLLTQLTLLDFSRNALTSAIPTEIGLLTQLTRLYFDTNALTSTIPSEIGLLTQLQYLGFSSNTLMGTIPSSLCSLPSVPTIYIDCGEITCACCGC